MGEVVQVDDLPLPVAWSWIIVLSVCAWVGTFIIGRRVYEFIAWLL